jgi:hypothetical protein
VQEGQFVSTEPPQSLDQDIFLPNHQGEVDVAIVALIIQQLADDLGIDAQYVRLEDPASIINPPFRLLRSKRKLTGGTTLKFSILTHDAGALATTLENLTSSPSFWGDVNGLLAEESLAPLDTSDMEVLTSPPTCNMNFRLDNASGTCVAELVQCSAGRFAGSGSATCNACPSGKYSGRRGAFGCKSCFPGLYQPNARAIACHACSLGLYQPAAGQAVCERCPHGKYANDESSTVCSGVRDAKNYITADAEGGRGPLTGEQHAHNIVYKEVVCPKAGTVIYVVNTSLDIYT